MVGHLYRHKYIVGTVGSFVWVLDTVGYCDFFIHFDIVVWILT